MRKNPVPVLAALALFWGVCGIVERAAAFLFCL